MASRSSKAKVTAQLEKEVGTGLSELYMRYTCDYCQEDIKGLRIKCVDCNDFDLCLQCFACGAQIGKHKNTHKYIFMNNGGFTIFPSHNQALLTAAAAGVGKRDKRLSSSALSTAAMSAMAEEGLNWNARENMRLLDAVEQFGYGNWKDIAMHIETKTTEQAKEEYTKHYIHGLIGKHTWQEELRGHAVDHTQAADRGPLSPTLTGKLPPINVNTQEALLLGYMPHRDDFEDFDKDTEGLVAQIRDKSVDDEDLDTALKLSQCDIYERRLREQVRRKRVARDYQLVGKFYTENPIIEIGAGKKFTPLKFTSQMRDKKKDLDLPKQELMDALKGVTTFHTSQEFKMFIDALCHEKEQKVRAKELIKYRDHGLTKIDQVVEFERQRFKHITKLKRVAKQIQERTPGAPGPNIPARFLPSHGDFCLKAILDPDYDSKTANLDKRFGGIGGKKRQKKSLWNRKKMKTGRRLLLQNGGCILTLASPARRDSTDTN